MKGEGPCSSRRPRPGCGINNQCKQVCTKFLLEDRLKKAPHLPAGVSRAKLKGAADAVPSEWVHRVELLGGTCETLRHESPLTQTASPLTFSNDLP